MRSVFHRPEAAVASPLFLAASPGVQQAMNAMVAGMITIFVFTMLLGCLSLGLMLLFRRAKPSRLQAGAKGWLGEAATRWLVLDRLDPLEYRVFHNLYVPRSDGAGTSQIDHVVVSRFGVFVIETKNLGGWLLGQEREAEWTQVVRGRKRRFQNPLRQNRGHVQALREFLELSESAFKPVVWLIGDAKFKTAVPHGVRMSGLKGFIHGHRIPCLDGEAVETAVARLAALERSTNRKTARREHLAGIVMRREGRRVAIKTRAGV